MCLRRLFVVFFVLLQAMGPLLHAHAGGVHHDGIHLPASGPVTPLPAEEMRLHGADEAVAFAMEISMEAGAKLMPRTQPALVAHLISSLASIEAPTWIPSDLPAAHPLLGLHLLPPACAPPHA